MRKLFGITLSGGGARAAYQVGALQALAEIAGPEGDQADPLFKVITGNSAGAINAAYLAARASDWRRGVLELKEIWRTLSPENIYHADRSHFGEMGAKWLVGAFLGSLIRKGSDLNHLLNTSPLRDFLTKHIPMAELEANLSSGKVHGLALTATNYYSGSSMVFFDGDPKIMPWARTDRASVRTKLSIEHVMASSAIPIFFPPVAIEDSFYGDGCIRQTTPLSPAIHLGSQKIIAIGIRHPRAEEKTLELSLKSQAAAPKLAQIMGVVLNSVFLDSIEADIERITRINQTLAIIPPENINEHTAHLRQIPVLMLRPSRDLGVLAGQLLRDFPPALRYILRGMGASKTEGADLMSYLAFDQPFTSRLIEIGYEDTLNESEKITEFLEL